MSAIPKVGLDDPPVAKLVDGWLKTPRARLKEFFGNRARL